MNTIETTTPKTSPAAIGYARVSTEKQDTERQQAAITRYAQLQEYDLKRYGIILDNGISGRSSAARRGGRQALEYYAAICNLDLDVIEREGYRKLLWSIIHEDVDVVLIYAIDRFSRDAVELLLLAQICQLHDASLVILSAGNSLDTHTAAGWLQYAMQACFAEYEVRVGSERTSATLCNMGTAWREGRRDLPHVGRPPNGWRKNPDTGKYEHDPDAWPVVELVHEFRDQGKTYTEISEQTGIPVSSIKRWLDAYGWQPPENEA